MKRKMIFPLLAVLLASIAAFANLPVQRAWFKNPLTGVVSEGDITTPAPSSGITCTMSGSSICKIGQANAYDSQVHAQDGDDDGLFRYNPAE